VIGKTKSRDIIDRSNMVIILCVISSFFL